MRIFKTQKLKWWESSNCVWGLDSSSRFCDEVLFEVFFYHSQVQCVQISRLCPLMLCLLPLEVFEVQNKAWWTMHSFMTLLDCLFLAQIHVCFSLLEYEFGMWWKKMSTKIAQSNPSWNPNIERREFLKLKFYDVWFEVSNNN